MRIILRGYRRLRRRMVYPAGTIHFLHVGKAAGTQMRHVIRQINENRAFKRKVVKHPHPVELLDLPERQDWFFSIRDPVTRFKSGFYARKRRDHIAAKYREPSVYEKLALERFAHANDLAEALFAPGQRGRDATAAIRSCRHNCRNLVDWFKYCGYVFEVRPPIWIIRQEQFQADLDVFLSRIGYDGPLDIATASDRRSNIADYDGIPELSETAKANLRRWYVQDYAFIDLCETWLNENDSYVHLDRSRQRQSDEAM